MGGILQKVCQDNGCKMGDKKILIPWYTDDVAPIAGTEDDL